MTDIIGRPFSGARSQKVRPGAFRLLSVMLIAIFAIIMPESKQPSTCSVSSPLESVGNSTLFYYDISSMLPSISSILGTRENSELCLSPIVRCVLQLTLVYYMRITELLSITAGDELAPGSFLVRALKGGSDYSIFIPLSARNVTELKKFKPSQPLFPVTYHTCWRQIRSSGCSQRLRWRFNLSVTHSGRFNLADKLVKLNERARIGPLLHHRTLTSADYYARGYLIK